jgi:hypothetical protein
MFRLLIGATILCALVTHDQDGSQTNGTRIESAWMDNGNSTISAPDHGNRNSIKYHLSGFRSSADDRKL